MRRNQHIKKCHPDEQPEGPQSKIECKNSAQSSDFSPKFALRCHICRREYLTQAKLNQHYRKFHPKSIITSSSSNNETSEKGTSFNSTAGQSYLFSEQNNNNKGNVKFMEKHETISSGSNWSDTCSQSYTVVSTASHGTQTVYVRHPNCYGDGQQQQPLLQYKTGTILPSGVFLKTAEGRKCSSDGQHANEGALRGGGVGGSSPMSSFVVNNDKILSQESYDSCSVSEKSVRSNLSDNILIINNEQIGTSIQEVILPPPTTKASGVTGTRHAMVNNSNNNVLTFFAPDTGETYTLSLPVNQIAQVASIVSIQMPGNLPNTNFNTPTNLISTRESPVSKSSTDCNLNDQMCAVLPSTGTTPSVSLLNLNSVTNDLQNGTRLQATVNIESRDDGGPGVTW